MRHGPATNMEDPSAERWGMDAPGSVGSSLVGTRLVGARLLAFARAASAVHVAMECDGAEDGSASPDDQAARLRRLVRQAQDRQGPHAEDAR